MCLERSMLHVEFNTVFRPLILKFFPHKHRRPAIPAASNIKCLILVCLYLAQSLA